MKKFIAIMLLSAILFAGTPLQQLLKLPVLVEHYFEHKQQDNSTSFAGYLIHHYFEEDNDNVDDDHARDCQLPFKSMALVVPASLLTVTTVNQAYPTAAPEIRSIQKPLAENEQAISAQYLSAIWQPPKSC